MNYPFYLAMSSNQWLIYASYEVIEILKNIPNLKYI